jgi:hypothetical protein
MKIVLFKSIKSREKLKQYTITYIISNNLLEKGKNISKQKSKNSEIIHIKTNME